MRKAGALFAALFFLGMSFGYALDWKMLHETADKISEEEALSAVRKNPDSLNELYVLGLVYLNVHKDKEAEEVFQKIIRLKPEAFEAKWGRAEALRRQRKIKESEELLKAIIKANPSFSPAYISLAYIRYLQLEFKQAVRLALKVIEEGREGSDLSNYTRAYLIYSGSKGMIASRGGPLSKVLNGTAVLPNLKKAEKLQPDSPAVLFGLGSFYFLAPKVAGGNIEKAVDYLKQAVQIDPLFADAHARLAQIYKMQGDGQKAAEYLNKAIQIDPQNELVADLKSKKCRFNCVTVNE